MGNLSVSGRFSAGSARQQPGAAGVSVALSGGAAVTASNLRVRYQTLGVSGGGVVTAAGSNGSESFTTLQQSINWHLLPAEVRNATDIYDYQQAEAGGTAFRVPTSDASPLTVEFPNGDGGLGSDSAHAGIVVSNYKITGPTNNSVQSTQNGIANSMYWSTGADLFSISSWVSPSSYPGLTISADPGIRAANHSYNMDGAGVTDVVGTARLMRALLEQWNVVSIMTCNNGSQLQQVNIAAHDAGKIILVSCLEDSGLTDHGVPSGYSTTVSGKSDFNSSLSSVVPDITVSGSGFDSYAAPVVVGVVRRLQAYFNGGGTGHGASKTGTQIRAAIINSRGTNRNLDCKAAYDRLIANLD